MFLRELSLRSFRNYDSLELEFGSNLIFFIGCNAQGKTNILESIFLSCTGRSHRTSRDRELIKRGHDRSLVKTRVEKLRGVSEISIYLSSTEKKAVSINGTPAKRMGELMGHLNCVMFSSEDLKIIKEGPVERRRFMDMEISQIKPKYFYFLQQYNRILNHRNYLLKEIQRKPALEKTLPVWNEQLAETGTYITVQRKNFVNSLQNIAREIHKKLSCNTEDLAIVYKSSVPLGTGDIREIKENFLKELEQRQADDIQRGITGIGCQRDDMLTTINGEDTRIFGSQGQKRTVVLSLKLSELEFMYRETGEYPLLLLDDVMSELDPFRQAMLIEYIGKVQTFITTTDLNQLKAVSDLKGQMFHIEAGQAREQAY